MNFINKYVNIIIGDKMKKILFTGARSGIAFQVIEKLLNKDYYIYVTVHTEKQLEMVKQYYQLLMI